MSFSIKLSSGWISFLLISFSLNEELPKKVILVSFDHLSSDFLDFSENYALEVDAFKQILHTGCFGRNISLLNISSESHGHSVLISGLYIDEVPLYLNETDYCDDFIMWKIKNNLQTLWSTNERHGFHSESFFWPDDYINDMKATKFVSLGVAPSKAEISLVIERIMELISSPDVNLISVFIPATSYKSVDFNSFFQETVLSANAFLTHILTYVRNDNQLKDIVNFLIVGGINPASPLSGSIFLENELKPMLLSNSHLSRSRILQAWSFQSEDIAKLKETSLYTICNTTTFRNRHPDFNAGILPSFYLIAQSNHSFVVRRSSSEGDNPSPKYSFILTSGPSFKSNSCDIKSSSSIQLVDIYPLVCWVLGLKKPSRNDGRLERVQHLLRYPPSSEQLAEFNEYASGRRSISSSKEITLYTLIFGVSVIVFVLLFAVLFTCCSVKFNFCERNLHKRRRNRRQHYSAVNEPKGRQEAQNPLLESTSSDCDEDVLMVNQSASKSNNASFELVQMLHEPLASGRSRLSLPDGISTRNC